MSTRQENIEKLGRMIEDIDVAMLTTLEPDGTLHSRPMATQETKFDGTLWFVTRATAPKVDEAQQHREASISYVDADSQRYVAIAGRARLVYGRDRLQELWSPIYDVWFPDGLDDPDLALLRVDVERAEYWAGPSNRVSQVIELVKGLVLDDDNAPPGDNVKLDL